MSAILMTSWTLVDSKYQFQFDLAYNSGEEVLTQGIHLDFFFFFNLIRPCGIFVQIDNHLYRIFDILNIYDKLTKITYEPTKYVLLTWKYKTWSCISHQIYFAVA